MNKLKKRIMQVRIIITYYFFVLLVKVFNIKNDNVWLISERGDEARDNGYAFYKFLKEYHPEINVKFIISKNSQDRNRIKKDDIVNYRGINHYIYYITSGYLISTHTQGTAPEFHSFTKLDRKKMLCNSGKNIFLQHGITKDYIPIMNKENNPSINLFICGARDEYNFLKKVLGFNDNEIKYTGFARFDYLKGNVKRQILLMPTWRNYLYNANEKEFIKSEYFKKYYSLINNDELIEILEKNDIELIFYPHYEVQKFLSVFTTKTDKIKIASISNYDVQKLLIESSILITDYSSVFFDFAYMKKPILYYQFDYLKYRKTQYSKGYFDYKENGFGPIFDDDKNLINEVKKIVKETKVSERYLKRINSFFELNDANNSMRIFDEITKLKK